MSQPTEDDIDKPGPWEGEEGSWFRRAAVHPDVRCSVREYRVGCVRWEVMFGMPGVCLCRVADVANTLDAARAVADAVADRMIRDVIERMNEALQAMPPAP